MADPPDDNKVLSPQERFSRLKQIFSPEKRGTDLGSSVSQLVVFAETVLQDNLNALAEESIDLYFSLNPPTNQFFIRAYFCKGQAIAPTNRAQEDKLQECLRPFAKGVNLAKKSQCYHFLIYNASVIVWKIIRPFSHPGSSYLYSSTLQHIVKALEEVKETDYQWRLTLMLALVRSQIDGSQKEEANKTAQSTLQFIRKRLPSLIVQVYKRLSEYGIGELKGIEKDTKGHPELSLLLKLWKLKTSLTSTSNDNEQKLTKLLLNITEGETTSVKKIAPLSPELAGPMIIKLGEIAAQVSCYEVVKKCIDLARIDTKELILRCQLLKAQLMVHSITNMYTPSSVQLRNDALMMCEEILNTCVDDEQITESFIEQTCVVVWNISLPFLQPSLRYFLYQPLSSLSNALNKISSLLDNLRLNVHIELAKINSDRGSISNAIDHIKSAQLLDCGGAYSEQLKFMRHRLELRNELYHVPEDPTDHAIQMIEQLISSELSKTEDNIEPLLLKIGDVLTDKQFSKLLTDKLIDENIEDISLIEFSSRVDEMERFREAITAHNFDDKNDKANFWVWSELVKLARKSLVWEVCLLACLYCLKYDDQRWQYLPAQQITPRKSKELRKKVSSSLSTTPEHIPSNNSFTISAPPYHQQKKLLLTLAQIHCIYAECLIHTLKCEGLSLGQPANPTKAGLTVDQCQGEIWIKYSDWVSNLTNDAHQSFIRAAEIGSTLNEEHLIYNSAVYLWNYHQHLILAQDTGTLVSTFRKIYQHLKVIQNISEQLCQIGTVLVNGLITKWVPPLSPTPEPAATTSKRKSGQKSGRQSGRASSKAAKGKKKDTGSSIIDQESASDLKEALEISEYLMSRFAAVPMPVRKQLIEEWTLTKLLLQQPVQIKTLPFDGERDEYTEHCRAVVGINMHKLMATYSFYEFPNLPSLDELFQIMQSCDWTSSTQIQLELYARLAMKAFSHQNTELVKLCCQNGLDLQDKLQDKYSYTMLSVISCLLGQSTNNNITALHHFTSSTKFGYQAGSYEQVIQSCRYAWNSCLSLVLNSKDRESLLGPFDEMLRHIMSLAGRRTEGEASEIASTDLQLIRDMYQVIFQIYHDKNEWKEGLQAIDSALWICPKSLHLFLTEHKVMFKSHLGGNIEGEMIRFQDEEPLFVAKLWFKIGQNSKGNQQCTCFQKAINLLQSPEHDEIKIEYIIELARWLYNNGYPDQDILEHILWAMELCSTDTVSGLDKLLQLHVMMSLCCDSEFNYMLQSVGYVLLILKGLVAYQTMEEWSKVTLSTEQITSITESQDTNIPSVHTISKPLLTMYYMDLLVEMLFQYNLQLMALPVLQLQLLIAQHIIQSEPLVHLVQLKLSVLCQELKLSYPSIDLVIRPQDIADVRSESLTTLLKVDNSVITSQVYIWQVWVKMAEILIKQGQYQTAIELLDEAKNISQIHNDTNTLVEIMLCEVSLSLFDKKYEKAIDLLIQAQKMSCTYHTWLKIVLCFCTVLNDTNQLIALLKRALATVESVLRGKPRQLCIVTAILTTRLLVLEKSNDIIEIKRNVKLLTDNGHTNVAINNLLLLVESSSRSDQNDLIKSIIWCKEAVTILQWQYEHIIQLTQPSPNVVLPVQRDLVHAQLVLSELFLTIAKEGVEKKKKLVRVKQDKSSIEKIIDEFVRESPTLDDVEQRLEDILQLAPNEGLSLISSSYILSENDSKLQGKCLELMGTFLRVISCDTSPDVSNEWIIPLVDKGASKLNNYSALSALMRKSEATSAQSSELVSLSFASQSVEVLINSVITGLGTQQLDIVKTAALELVNIFGVYDTYISSSYLSLYQSCLTSLYMSDLLTQCLSYPNQSQLSTLIQQYNILPTHLPSHKASSLKLNDYECWKRLYVEPQHLEILKSFHCDVRFLMMQHSPDRSYIYTSYLVPPQPPPPAPKKGQPPIDYKPIAPAISCCSVAPDDFANLQKLMKQYKEDVSLAIRHQKKNNEEMLQSQFDYIVSALEIYLSDSVALFDSALHKEDEEVQLTLVLLVDKELAELPLEALPCLHKKRITKISRDFCLQLLHHRLKQMSSEESSEDEAKKKNFDKYQPQPSSLLANTTSFKYILDPRNDLHCSNIDEIKSVINNYPKLTGKWTGVSGTDHALSCGEWSSVIQNGTGLIIVCSEKCLNHCSSQYLAPLNLSSIGIALIVDLLTSTSSYRTQSKLDAFKSNADKELEGSLVMVMILSLAGINSIYCNQWAEPCSEGVNQVVTIIKDLLSKSTCTGQIHSGLMKYQTELTEENALDISPHSLLHSTYNGVLYGLPHITLIPDN